MTNPRTNVTLGNYARHRLRRQSLITSEHCYDERQRGAEFDFFGNAGNLTTLLTPGAMSRSDQRGGEAEGPVQLSLARGLSPTRIALYHSGRDSGLPAGSDQLSF